MVQIQGKRNPRALIRISTARQMEKPEERHPSSGKDLSYDWPARLIDFPKHQAAVVPTKPEAIGNGAPYAHLASSIGHVIEVAAWVGGLIVDGRVNHAALDCQSRRDGFDAAAGTQKMADHALGAADGELLGMV